MNKSEFMEQLKSHLKRLPHEEYNEAIAYYEEYLEEGGDETLESLGTPQQVAAKIFADYVEKPKEDGKKDDRNKLLVIILVICGIPILLPVGIGLFSAALGVFAAIFGAIIGTVWFVISGIFSGFMGFTIIASDPLSAIFFIGWGMFSVAISYFVITELWGLLGRAIKWISALGGKVLRRFSK